jgi:2-amino-1-hydroxyethylphosphonate dioxygenase (glycine-forming)
MKQQDISDVVNTIISYYERYGANDYIGEPVSQIEHMVQGAMFAEHEGRSKELIISMFLHDIGHLLIEDNTDFMGSYGVKDHEGVGRRFLEECGIPYPIPNLVENHVKVKRYLVYKKKEYYQKLSPASKKTLEYQGGPMSEEEALVFEQDPIFNDSLLVRSYDERSKVVGMKIKSLDYYRRFITDYLSEYYS